MRWARDVVAEDREVLIRSVTSLLIVTTRVMVVGTDADLTVVHVTKTTLDVVATAIGILTTSDGDAVIAIVISMTTAPGVAAGKDRLTPSERIRIMTYPTSCGCGGTGRRAGLRSL